MPAQETRDTQETQAALGDHPDPTPEQLAEATRLRARAGQSHARREESFERCDTDGFLSQWAHGLSADRCAAQAEVLEHGGHAQFVGLFEVATGRRVPARIISTEFGPRWMVCDPSTGRATGVFYPTGSRSRKQKAAGLEERREWAAAEAKIVGRGTGLSGSAWVEVVRTDGGWPGAPTQEPRS